MVYNQERLILKTIYVVNKEIQGDSYVATRSSRNHLVFSLVCTRQLSSLVVNLTITLHWDWLSCLSRAKEGAKWSAFSRQLKKAMRLETSQVNISMWFYFSIPYKRSNIWLCKIYENFFLIQSYRNGNLTLLASSEKIETSTKVYLSLHNGLKLILN